MGGWKMKMLQRNSFDSAINYNCVYYCVEGHFKKKSTLNKIFSLQIKWLVEWVYISYCGWQFEDKPLIVPNKCYNTRCYLLTSFRI